MLEEKTLPIDDFDQNEPDEQRKFIRIAAPVLLIIMALADAALWYFDQKPDNLAVAIGLIFLAAANFLVFNNRRLWGVWLINLTFWGTIFYLTFVNPQSYLEIDTLIGRYLFPFAITLIFSLNGLKVKERRSVGIVLSIVIMGSLAIWGHTADDAVRTAAIDPVYLGVLYVILGGGLLAIFFTIYQNIPKFIQGYLQTSLRTKLIAVIVGLSLATVVALFAVNILSTQTALTESALASLASLGDNRSDDFAEMLRNRVNTMMGFALVLDEFEDLQTQNASYTGSQAAIEADILRLDAQWQSGSGDTLIRSVLDNELASEASHFLDTFDTMFVETFITDKYGANVAAAAQTSDYYQADEGWWQAAYNNGKGAIFIGQPEFDESTGTYGFNIAVPAFSEETGQIVGIVRTTALFGEFLDELDSGLSESAFGEIVFHATGAGILSDGSQTGYTEEDLDEQENALDRAVGSGTGANAEFLSVNIIGHGEGNEIEALDWHVVLHELQSEVLAPVQAQTRTSILLAIGIAALVSVIAAVLANAIANPIVKLTDITAQIAEGDYDVRAEVTSGDEVGLLGTSVNNMAQQVGDLVRDIAGQRDVLEQRAIEMEASQRVTFAASERTTPEDFLNLVVNLIRDVFDMYHAQVYLLNDDKSVAELRESSGYAGRMLLQRRHAIPMDRTSLVTTAIKTSEAVLVGETEKDPNWLPNELLPETKSELVVPLIQEGVVLGALDIQSRIPGFFTERSVPLFQQMTNQIAFLFENSSLLAEITDQTASLEQFSDQLRVSAEVAARLNTINNLEDLLDEAVNQLQSRFNFYHAHVYMPDEANEKFVVQAGSGHVGYTLKRNNHSIPTDSQTSLVARAARERQPVVVDDVLALEGYVANPLLPNTHSEVAIPLMLGDRLIGVLDLQDENVARFTQADIDTLQTLAGQIASSIESAQFFEEVQASEERFRIIVDNAPEAIFTFNGDNAEILDVNPNMIEMLEYSEEELVGNTVGAISPEYQPDGQLSGEAAAVQIQQAVIGEKPRFDWMHRTKSGQDILVDIRLVRMPSSEPYPVIRASLTDITEEAFRQLETSTELEVTQALAGDLSEEEIYQVMVALVKTHNLGRLAMYSIETGKDDFFSVTNLLDEPFDTGMTPLGVGTVMDSQEYPFLDAMVTERVVFNDINTDPRLQDNNLHQILSSIGYTSMASYPLEIMGEKNFAFVISSTEKDYFTPDRLMLYNTLAEHVSSALSDARLRAEVTQSEVRMRALVDNAPDAILTLNAVESKFVDVNRRGLEMFGYTREEFFKLSPADISAELEPDGSNAAQKSIEYIQRAMEGETIATERNMKTADGREFLVDFNLIKLPGTDNLVRGSLVDITERSAARDTLVQGDRLKSEFLANMSHELRTPLNSIIGYTDVLLMGLDGDLDEEVQEDIKAIHDNGQHLLGLINDVLDLAKIEAGRMTLEVKPVDVKSMLSDLHKKNAGLVLNKDVEMKLDVAKGLPNINGDEHRLSQVLTNLISNAVKFTEKGKITLKAFEDKKDVVMQVIDTGIGIEKEDLKAIFDEFTQVDASYSRRAEGTGLGLTITQNLVKMHGGTISVESKYGKGSTFSLRIPVDNVIKPEFTEAVPVKPKANGNKKGAKKKGDTKALA